MSEKRKNGLSWSRLMTGGIGLPAVGFPQAMVLAGHVIYRLWGGLSAREVRVEGLKWSYLAGGRGEVIVFVHGFGADKYRFGPVVPSLSRSYRIIAPDLPGFGESAKSTAISYDVRSQVGRLAAFLDALGLDRFHLFGVSMGGYLAAFFAAQQPERVLSLALVDPAGVRSPRPSHMLRRYEADGTILLLYRNRRQFEALLDALFYKPPWIPGFVKDYSVRQALADFPVREKVLGDLVGGGTGLLNDRLGEIRAKTLVMWGAEDRIVDPSGVAIFTAGIPSCRAVVFEACGHVPIIEKWRESARVYRQFLAEIAQRGRAV